MQARHVTVQYRDRVTEQTNPMRLHSHDRYEIYSYLSGDPYFYFIKDTMYELRAGDILILRPGVLHGGCIKRKTRGRKLYVGVSAQTLELLSGIDPKLTQMFSEGDFVKVRPPGEDAAEYARLTEQIREQKQARSRFSDLLIFSLVIRQLVMICRCAENLPEGKARAGSGAFPGTAPVRRAIEYINSNWAAISSAGTVAGELHYSESYLSYCFKKHMNLSLRAYLMEKKLSEAAALLINGGSVTDCAFRCGFGSSSHFISLFKRRYGVTPGRYAKRNKH